jgi:hypothetical protein
MQYRVIVGDVPTTSSPDNEAEAQIVRKLEELGRGWKVVGFLITTESQYRVLVVHE